MDNTGGVKDLRWGATLVHVAPVRTLPSLGWWSFFCYKRAIMKTLSKLTKQVMHRSMTSVCPQPNVMINAVLCIKVQSKCACEVTAISWEAR